MSEKDLREITAHAIAQALEKQGIVPTPEHVEKVVHVLRDAARDAAKSVLSDEDDWRNFL